MYDVYDYANDNIAALDALGDMLYDMYNEDIITEISYDTIIHEIMKNRKRHENITIN